MSFDPSENEPRNKRFGFDKKSSQDPVFDLFGAGKVEFEPIDDDDDDVPPTAKIESNIETTPDKPARDPKNIDKPEKRKVHSERPNRPATTKGKPILTPKTVSEPILEKPQATKSPATTSHWDLLANSLGIAGEAKSTEPDSPQKTAAPSVPSSRTSGEKPAERRPPRGVPEFPPAQLENPLEELFVPSGEVFEPVPTTPRMVDDISIDPSDDFIEFEVEDLVPGDSKRKPRDARPPREQRRSRSDEPGTRDTQSKRNERPKSRDNERRPSNKDTQQRPAGDSAKLDRDVESDVEGAAETPKTARRNQPRTRTTRDQRPESKEPRREKVSRPKSQNDFQDEGDDFVDIPYGESDEGDDKKSITTWQQAISVIVESNIKSRDRSKPNGQGRKQGRDDYRRR